MAGSAASLIEFTAMEWRANAEVIHPSWAAIDSGVGAGHLAYQTLSGNGVLWVVGTIVTEECPEGYLAFKAIQ